MRRLAILLLLCSVCMGEVFTNHLTPLNDNALDVGTNQQFWRFMRGYSFTDGTGLWSNGNLSGFLRLGLGTDTLDSKLTIQEGNNPLTAGADAASILIRGVGALGITFATGTDGSGNIFFDDGEGGNGRGRIIYDHSDDSLAFYTNSSEAINIDSDGNILISGGSELRFNDVDNSHYVGFEAPALTASQIWVLPDADGDSGELLSTDGSGALVWSADGNIPDDTAYDATSWNGNAVAATKNAIRDKIETIDTAIGLNTTHRGSNGSDHSYIDQSVVSGAAPAFTADNFSDGGSNAIITTTQETNFETAYDHSQDNTQAHTDYLINDGNDSTSGSLTATDFYVGDGGKMGSASAYFTANESSNFLTTSADTWVGFGTDTPLGRFEVNDGSNTDFVVLDNGKVGIGMGGLLPSRLFQIRGVTGWAFEIETSANLDLNRGGHYGGGIINQWAKTGSDSIFDIYNMYLDRAGGVGGVGLGFRWVMKLENGAGDRHEAGGIELKWADPTADSEDSTMTLQTYVNGALDESLVIKDGNIRLTGNLIGPNDMNIGSVGTPGAITIASDGTVSVGDGTNEVQITNSGELTYVGTAGITIGSCYGNHIADVISNAAQNTWYDVNNVGFVTGTLKNVTHDGDGQLTVLKAGIYFVAFDVTWEVNSANVHTEFGIMVDGAAAMPESMIHTESKFANTQGQNSLSGCYLDLAVNQTIEVGVRTVDVGTPTYEVDVVNISCFQVGG